MLLFGLALCDQQTIVLLVPAFAVLAWQGWALLPRASGRLRISARDLGLALGAFVVGLLPYAYLPIAASASPALNWGDPSSLHRFYVDVSRGNYGTTTLISGQSGSVGENLRLILVDLSQGFVFAGIALAIAGLAWSWRHRRAEGLALLTAFLVAGPVFMAVTHPGLSDELTKGIVARFYILPSIPLAMLAGLGAWWCLGVADRVSVPRRGLVTGIAAVALLLVPVAAAAAHFSTNDQSGNRVAADYGEDLLGPLAPNAVLLMRGDENYESVAYAQVVEPLPAGRRRARHRAAEAPELRRPGRARPPGRGDPVPRVRRWESRRRSTASSARTSPRIPCTWSGSRRRRSSELPSRGVHYGLVDRLARKGTVPDPYAVTRANASLFEQLRYPTKRYPATSWESVIARDYGEAALSVAFALAGGDAAKVPEAEKMYRTAILLAPTEAVAYKNLGLLLYQHGGDASEIASLWNRYLELDPAGPDAGRIRAALARLKGTP